MGKKTRGVLIGIICVAVVVAAFVLLSQGATNFQAKYAGVDLSTDVEGIGRDDTYDGYLAAHANVGTGAEMVELPPRTL